MHMKPFVLLGLAYSIWVADATVTDVISIEKTNQKTRFLETADFVPLACNSNLSTSTCNSWSVKFGVAAIQSKRVIIGCGECITMDHPGPSLTLLDGLDIQGKLVFPNNYKLEVKSPLILVQGELEMQANKPVDGKPSIKFLMTSDSVQYFTPIGVNANACSGSCAAGKKAIVVAGGKVNIRGLPTNTPAWVRLYDITADSRSIVVNATVKGKWAPGAEILITSHTRSWNSHQVRNITQVSAYGSDQRYVTLTLNSAIDRPTTLIDSPDFAVEVALLSRNVVFMGGDDANKAHGGHFWVMNTPKVKQYIEGVDFQKFGQQGNIGRYPIHFHFCGDVTGSVVTKNTIRQSNQRCVVVHGTDKLRVEENVAFDTKGHCYLLEDGIETGNAFIRNLGAQTSIPATIIPNLGPNGRETDDMPSTFWITNPSNTWIGNVAAGSESSGFWFEAKIRGSRAAQFAQLDPLHGSLTLFQDNVAHSNAIHGLKTYTPGYLPDQEATFLGFKCYRNIYGMFIHVSRNIVVKGGLFADNMLGVDIDRDDAIRIEDTKVIGESDSYRSLMAAKRLDTKVCNNPHIGIELHTQLRAPRAMGIVIKNVEFTGFSHIPCSDAVPFLLDSSTETGLFDSFTTMQNIVFTDNDGDSIDFCRAEAAKIIDIYLIDLDGSLRPPGISTLSTGAAALVSDQPNMLNFVDSSKCTPNEGRCFSFCEGTCFRTVRYAVDPAGSYTLKVCSSGSSGNCIFIVGYARTNNPTFAKRPREFIAHLPMGAYDAVFVNSNGTDTWPSFVNVAFDDALCPESFQVGDINLIVPPLREAECADLIKNGNFQASNTNTTFWLYNDGGIKLAKNGGVAGSNGASGIDTSALTTFFQFIDNRCIRAAVGQFYEIRASIKLTNADGSVYICNSAQRDCPDIGLSTDDGFTRVATVTSGTASGFQLAQGFVRIDDRMAASKTMAVYVRSRVSGKLMTADDVSMKLQVQDSYCGNLIRGADMENSAWQGLWTPNALGVPGVFSSATPGFNSATAFRYGKRSTSAEGPMYAAFRNVDLACLTQGSSWRIVAQLKLVNRKTGLGVTCDLNKRDDCPSIRLSIRDGSGNRFFAQQWRTYADTVTSWKANTFNRFLAEFTLPGADTWDGRVKTVELLIRDFPAVYDLIVDDVALSLVT